MKQGQISPMRRDDPDGVMKLAGSYEGGTALIVLGGLSAGGNGWKDLRDAIRPDVILGANAACLEIKDLDHWMIAENMSRAAGGARTSQRDQKFMRMFTEDHNAKVRLISCLSWHLLPNYTNCISIRRWGEADPDGYDRQIKEFTCRDYGDGYLHGPLFDYPGALQSGRIKYRVGTVGAHLLHHAGILGVREVHTIGFDLCFKDELRHHWYDHPGYIPDRFRTAEMFIEYNGIQTQRDWLASAQWLKTIIPTFERDGLKWTDHSNGLLKAVGLEGAE